MRVLIFHGYLLRGTGSNVYTASLATALAGLGHEVHLLCQEREPLKLPWVDAVGRWEDDHWRIDARREAPRVTVYRPELDGLLPVYVRDRYDGIEARPFAELADDQLDAYLERNVAAVRAVAQQAPPDVALAGHLVMGPAILARALEAEVPYAVKVHGSALEYTVKPHPRFLPYAREGLARSSCVLVGSRHTAESLWEAMEDRTLPARTRLGPPGVDVAAFAPLPRPEAGAALKALVEELASSPPAGDDESAFARDERDAAAALRRIHPDHDRLVAFVGKLIVSKGVDLLLAAWPLVVTRVPEARLAVVGFGAYRKTLERLLGALAAGDLDAVRALANAGREAEGGERAPLTYQLAFLDSLDDDRERREDYLRAARAMVDRVVFVGRLEHTELTGVLPLAEALVVPSTFPEAFGMVAAEAAACGALPVSADHSGLAEVSRALAPGVPAAARDWLSFELGPGAVDAIAARLVAWLRAPEELRAAVRSGLVAVARERYSWEGVAGTVLAGAQGRLQALPVP